MTKLATALLLAALLPGAALAQSNAGDQKANPDLPFTVTKVATFDLPWRIAFLPDGRMLVTEKVGPVYLVTPDGTKTELGNVPKSWVQGQNGMLGVYLSPHYATDHNVYLTYVEPGEYGGGVALGRGKLVLDDKPRLEGFEVLWRQVPTGKGGQPGGAIAFSPDGKYLFLTLGDRQRFTPAQDPNQPVGKILRLTLDGKPAPGNPWAGKTGSPTIPLIDPAGNTEKAKTAPVVSTYTFPGKNLTPSETWATGFRTPYGLAFAPDGKLWELEHGPRGGDELNLIERGKNYGWPLVSYGKNYDGVPIPSPDTRRDLVKPVIYWVPVVAPGNLMFYHGDLFAKWKGSAFLGGLFAQDIVRVTFDGKGGAQAVDRWDMGKRVRDIEEAPDGSLWMVEDASPGGLFRLTPKN
ncbi:PQQ-dependent sugar dehydrogenase [Luteibacter yeojuensis]|uniref:Dehydrogenase n=1 Tax=Luteibacter yeojuensis TaxID=345309 RepID=A0A0F3KUD7_9GAMM|nr:PQQ-dependent sugar dehydrogenase [Luteibacter yeojuensis]KJV34838.1 dehydrogenase [Luteibacter yeojuensis]